MDLHLVSILPEDMISFVGDHRQENLCRGGSMWCVHFYFFFNQIKKSPSMGVFEKVPWLAGCKGEVTVGRKQVTNGKDAETFSQ